VSIPLSKSYTTPMPAPAQDPFNKVNEQSGKVKEADRPATAVAKSQASLNSAIVQSQMNVSISSGDNSLTLLFKTAIEGINEVLGEDAIQNAASQDNSAEATAGRIVDMSTAFYNQYLQQNKLEDSEESRGKFVDLISEGFEKGFKEAQDILKGLKVLEGDVASGIDKTHELVLKGFAAFRAGPQPDPDAQPTPAPDGL
jgi:hypothetical protein